MDGAGIVIGDGFGPQSTRIEGNVITRLQEAAVGVGFGSRARITGNQITDN